jgi:hypothetical protein
MTGPFKRRSLRHATYMCMCRQHNEFEGCKERGMAMEGVNLFKVYRHV